MMIKADDWATLSSKLDEFHVLADIVHIMWMRRSQAQLSMANESARIVR